MPKLNVTIVGATGEAGQSVVDALLGSPEQFTITALARPSSVTKDSWVALRDRGMRIVTADPATATPDDLASLLAGVDVLISTILPSGGSREEKNLATAAKTAGVGRFIPSFWATPAPPRGVMRLREWKEDVLDHVKRLYLPYTVIDIGWWFQLSLPRLPSGRIDDALITPHVAITADGDAPIALTHKDDLGRFVARIITDPRTLNRHVFAHAEDLSQHQIWKLVEDLSGESIPRAHTSAEELVAQIEAARTAIAQAEEQKAKGGDKSSPPSIETPAELLLSGGQYWYSMAVRRDNTPEHARYLGYLDARELYPDFEPRSFRSYVDDVLAGRATKPYTGRFNFGPKTLA